MMLMTWFFVHTDIFTIFENSDFFYKKKYCFSEKNEIKYIFYILENIKN